MCALPEFSFIILTLWHINLVCFQQKYTCICFHSIKHKHGFTSADNGTGRHPVPVPSRIPSRWSALVFTEYWTLERVSILIHEYEMQGLYICRYGCYRCDVRLGCATIPIC
jgi:hypothetical protein